MIIFRYSYIGLLKHICAILLHYLSPSLGQILDFILPEIGIFLDKQFLQAPRKFKFFPMQELKWQFKGKRSDEYDRCSRTGSTNFWKEMWGLVLSWWRIIPFWLANWMTDFGKGACNTQCSSKPTRYTASSFWIDGHQQLQTC